MNMMRFTFIAAAAAAGLAACATLSEDVCRGGNWSEIGLRDGSNGRSSDFFEQHIKACARFGIPVNQTEWEAGRQQGLKSYCTRHNAYRQGARGLWLRPVCPADNLDALEAANKRGRIWFDIGRDISDANREINDINSRLASLPANDPKRTSLLSRRSFLLLEIAQLRARRAQYRF